MIWSWQKLSFHEDLEVLSVGGSIGNPYRSQESKICLYSEGAEYEAEEMAGVDSRLRC